jgi:ribulose bisphosphate carboxylase small subunit
MKRNQITAKQGSTLVIVVSVVATILVLLAVAVSLTQQTSRVADRSRKSALALEVADGHLEYLFSNWRNIYRGTWTTYGYASGGTDYSLVGTNYFYTTCASCSPTPSGPAPVPVQNMNPSGTPLPIPLPSSNAFPNVPNYTVTQFRIQGIDPMIDQDVNKSFGTDPERALRETSFGSGNFQVLPYDAAPNAAYGPNTWRYSFYYLAAADVSVPVMNGTVTAKVRRIFEKKFDNPWSYAMFYVDDLELSPPTDNPLTLTGPVHTNGALYMATPYFTSTSPVEYVSEYLNEYSPNDSSGHSGATGPPNLPSNMPPSQVAPYLPFGWNVKINYADTSQNNDGYREIIEQPVGTDDVNLTNIRLYNQAGIRVFIDQSNNVTIKNASDVTVTSGSSGNDKNIYDAITSALIKDKAILDYRENAYVRLTTFDVSKLTTVAELGTGSSGSGSSKIYGITGFNGVIWIGDTTTNGTGVTSKMGGTGTSVNTTERGIRLINGSSLPAGFSGGSDKTKWNVAGLTVVSPNPMYIQGNYNTGGTNPPSNSGTYTTPVVSGYTRKDAAIMGDAINVLSNGWIDTDSDKSISNRAAENTTLNCALVSGNVPSSGGNYSGGGENFVRLLEDWKNNTLCYYGSMVQLFKSKYATGPWSGSGANYKSPLVSKFYWDTAFGDTSAPPGNLQIAAYLQQQRWYQVY